MKHGTASNMKRLAKEANRMMNETATQNEFFFCSLLRGHYVMSRSCIRASELISMLAVYFGVTPESRPLNTATFNSIQFVE